MKYLLKYSPEISIKSRPVRSRFVKQLKKNLQFLLGAISQNIVVTSHWDYLEVNSEQDEGSDVPAKLEEILKDTPGIGSFARVYAYPFQNLSEVLEYTLRHYKDRLQGKTFAVRCKRVGKHAFKSVDVEKYVGGGLNQQASSAGVKLKDPDIGVRLEIRDQDVFIIDALSSGMGGFPLGTQDAVLSLISGGFDSAVSSYLSIRRGLSTHFCFFNLGGHDHEIAVKEVALYLWMRYGASQRVKFVTVPFEAVVGEILSKIDNSQMGVILKRMMLRAAEQVADALQIDALVTGEAVAQVSSQTLANLAVIDEVSHKLVLRPLIMSEKQDIIDLARKIGTEEFSAVIPEYCGVISVKPTTRARLARIEKEESAFDFDILKSAVMSREVVSIDQIVHQERKQSTALRIEEEPGDAMLIDIRHPNEEELKPLKLAGCEILKIPFYKLNTAFSSGQIDTGKICLLYCDKGIMSRLHASYLLEQGYENVGVYRPAARI